MAYYRSEFEVQREDSNDPPIQRKYFKYVDWDDKVCQASADADNLRFIVEDKDVIKHTRNLNVKGWNGLNYILMMGISQAYLPSCFFLLIDADGEVDTQSMTVQIKNEHGENIILTRNLIQFFPEYVEKDMKSGKKISRSAEENKKAIERILKERGSLKKLYPQAQDPSANVVFDGYLFNVIAVGYFLTHEYSSRVYKFAPYIFGDFWLVDMPPGYNGGFRTNPLPYIHAPDYVKWSAFLFTNTSNNMRMIYAQDTETYNHSHTSTYFHYIDHREYENFCVSIDSSYHSCHATTCYVF